MNEQEQRQSVVEEVKTWIGTPYHHQGRIKGVGVDCATILCEVYEAVGLIPHVDPRPYPPDWHLHRDGERYMGWMHQYAKEIDNPKHGDIALWKFGRCFSHGGIIIAENTIVHSYLKIGVTIERMDSSIFENRDVKYFSLWA